MELTVATIAGAAFSISFWLRVEHRLTVIEEKLERKEASCSSCRTTNTNKLSALFFLIGSFAMMFTRHG